VLGAAATGQVRLLSRTEMLIVVVFAQQLVLKLLEIA
jgi:hypothetical protein